MNRSPTTGNEIPPFFGYVAVLRPTLLFFGLDTCHLGYYYGIMMSEAPTSVHSLQPWTTFCRYTLLLGTIYIVNQKTDAVNDKLYLVTRGYVNLEVLKWQIGILITRSIVLGLLVFHGNATYLIYHLPTIFYLHELSSETEHHRLGSSHRTFSPKCRRRHAFRAALP